MAEPGVVAIGRNEGERLRLCLESVVGHAQAVVYVDSGSSDGSVELARSLGVEKAGWTILRIDAEMTLHDAAMNLTGDQRDEIVLWDQELDVEKLQRRLGLREPIIEVFSNDPRLADLVTLDSPAPKRRIATAQPGGSARDPV